MTDRELDIAVAEKVMGWYLASWCGEMHWHNGHGKKEIKENEWCPSTDISAAWEVIEKMSEEGYPVVIDNNDYRKHYECTFMIDDVTFAQAEGPTVPRAICIAALKALDHERD